MSVVTVSARRYNASRYVLYPRHRTIDLRCPYNYALGIACAGDLYAAMRARQYCAIWFVAIVN
jgi:hypothetical protein